MLNGRDGTRGRYGRASLDAGHNGRSRFGRSRSRGFQTANSRVPIQYFCANFGSFYGYGTVSGQAGYGRRTTGVYVRL